MMKKWQRELQRRFDAGEDAEGSALSTTPEAQAYLDSLRLLRGAAQSAVSKTGISDAQFPAFLAGIREHIESPRRSHRGLWAAVSLTAASLIAAVSAYVVFFSGPDKSGTVVEAATTYIQGATVDEYESEDGTRGVWVNDAARDLL